MRSMRGREGFTLIELLVVVAILAILLVIAVPRILFALENARRSEAVATATTIANAMARYYIQNEGYPEPEIDGGNLEDIEVKLREHMAVRNPGSIEELVWVDGFSGEVEIGDETVTVPGSPHDWYMLIRFSDAVCVDGEDAECVITAEWITWAGDMR